MALSLALYEITSKGSNPFLFVDIAPIRRIDSAIGERQVCCHQPKHWMVQRTAGLVSTEKLTKPLSSAINIAFLTDFKTRT